MGKILFNRRSIHIMALSLGLAIPSFAASISGDSVAVIPRSLLDGAVLISVVLLGVTARQIFRTR